MKDLSGFPAAVKREIGHDLHIVQTGAKPSSAKPLKGFGGASVLEIVAQDQAGTYRAVYTVQFAQIVFVLHCFQKKSKRGASTPRAEIELIKSRLYDAVKLYQEQYEPKG